MNVTRETTTRAMETGAKIASAICAAAILILTPTLLSQSLSINRALASIDERVGNNFATIQDVRIGLKELSARLSAVETNLARIDERIHAAQDGSSGR